MVKKVKLIFVKYESGNLPVTIQSQKVIEHT